MKTKVLILSFLLMLIFGTCYAEEWGKLYSGDNYTVYVDTYSLKSYMNGNSQMVKAKTKTAKNDSPTNYYIQLVYINTDKNIFTISYRDDYRNNQFISRYNCENNGLIWTDCGSDDNYLKELIKRAN